MQKIVVGAVPFCKNFTLTPHARKLTHEVLLLLVERGGLIALALVGGGGREEEGEGAIDEAEH